MTDAADLIRALEGPAALLDASGQVLAASPSFAAHRLDPAWLAGLEPGERRETLDGDGALTAWRMTLTPDGARILSGMPVPGAGEQRERYLASLSHELRTPLNGVLGMAGLLAETRLAADQRSYLAAVRDCGEHLLGLVNDILDLARMDAGQLTLHLAPVRINRLLQSTAELLSPRAKAKGLEIGWSIPRDLPVVRADEGRLRQILFNLAGNAIKFTETGGALLSAQARPAGPGRVRLRFWVADTGPGVPEAQRERIFEVFAQARPEHGARGDSSGLGLAIVRRLAAAHGGRAGVEAPPEGGSRFWFEADFEIEALEPSEHPLEGRAVAVFSPNPIVREAARALIETAGGLALTAPSPVHVPDGAVVLVDHALAAGEGRRGRALRPIVGHPSVILLAPEDRGAIARYREAGFAGYLIKPLRDVSLVERVLAALDGAPGLAASDERAAAQAAAGARVLLAEDNPINALLARSLLEREGCVVDRVGNGHDALAAAASVAYDLILMDLRMPGLDGRQTAEALRERGCRAPIVALTADAFEEDRRACLEAGMDDFLTKPLKPAVLQAMLQRWARSGWTPAKARAKLAS
ncbi:MAG TPA: response regulator [Caulobacteraceae bacterium]|jgi:signal transduction histidine kinase/CheY-like chemotaxis protein|nr:response regulator [Caulobacteraceae bacterium]